MSAGLYFTTGAWSGRLITLREPEARIGRDPHLEVVIAPDDQRFVSRVHATIRKDANRYVLEDRDSSNGTLVNGARVQRAVLADGDEIQFGRHGPVARFRIDQGYAGTIVETAGETAELPRHASPRQVPGRAPSPPPLPLPSPRLEAPRPVPIRPTPPPAAESQSRIVRRLVNEALARNTTRARRRWLAAAVLVAAIAAGAVVAMQRYGVFETPEQAFARLAEQFQSRVVLVEVGINVKGRYFRLGNGTGFFADTGGLIITNKHVVYPHLYGNDSACLRESFKRHGVAYDVYDRSLVFSVWPGGTDFRQKATSASGDRGLGYSTDNKTLKLVTTAANTLQPPTTIHCEDSLGGSPFEYEWQSHAMDNHDLAVLRAAKAFEPIPLADREPQTDDDVMVLGFPRGVLPLETNKAEPIRRIGNVLRTRDTIQIDAVVLGGNSGGPLIDRQGRVVGVTTRGTAESLNMAIKVEHVRRLLERAQQMP